MLYLCLIPNRGARIGHQTFDYFSIYTFCYKNNINYVYHDFIGNSEKFTNFLNFDKLHQYKFNDIKDNMKIIHLKDIITDFYNNIEKFKNENNEEDICIYGEICRNEDLIGILRKYITIEDEIFIKLKHRNELYHIYPNIVTNTNNNEYIAIHVRCGDVVNNKTRYIGFEYFINTYNLLVK